MVTGIWSFQEMCKNYFLLPRTGAGNQQHNLPPTFLLSLTCPPSHNVVNCVIVMYHRGCTDVSIRVYWPNAVVAFLRANQHGFEDVETINKSKTKSIFILTCCLITGSRS